MSIVYVLLLKCSLFSAVVAWAWVDVLTAHRGMFDWVIKYYPLRWANKPLGCAFCLSGWINWVCVLLSIYYVPIAFSIPNLALILFSPFFAMAIVKIIQGNGR